MLSFTFGFCFDFAVSLAMYRVLLKFLQALQTEINRLNFAIKRHGWNEQTVLSAKESVPFRFAEPLDTESLQKIKQAFLQSAARFLIYKESKSEIVVFDLNVIFFVKVDYDAALLYHSPEFKNYDDEEVAKVYETIMQILSPFKLTTLGV